MMDERRDTQGNRIRFRLCTGTRWISGYVTTPHRRFVDILNKEKHQSILVEELSAQSCFDSGDGGDKSDRAYLNPSSILFATPVEDSMRTGERDPMVWVRKRPERTRFALGPFAVEGNIHLLENATLGPSFLAAGDRFAPVTKAVLRRDDDPGFAEEEDVIFVNKDRVEYLIAAES